LSSVSRPVAFAVRKKACRLMFADEVSKEKSSQIPVIA
jgi:hypothetical protein